MKDISDKEFILASKKRGMPLSKALFERKYIDILKQIDEHNISLEYDIFSQAVYNWIFNIKENPKCPLTGLNLKFNYHEFKYESVRGKGRKMPEIQQIITKKRLEKVDYKKLYDGKRSVEPIEIDFTNLKHLLEHNFPKITNFGGFTVKFLSRFPEYYNYVNSDKFLPWCGSFQEKIYCVINDIQNQNGKKYIGFTKGYSKYNNSTEHKRCEIINKLESAITYELDQTITLIKEYIEKLKDDNKATNNLRQSFMRLDPNLVKSILYHTTEYDKIKFSNRVFLLLNGEPDPEKSYIKPVFFSLEKGYDMRFSSQKGTSKPEQEMMDWLSGLIPNLKKDRTVLNGSEIDIYSEEYKIGIEYDGVYWHNYEIVGNNKMFLKRKVAYSKGVKLLNIFETEWLNKKEIVKSLICSKFGIVNEKIFARKCEIREIDSRTCIDFLEDNHLQGRDNSKYKYGLFYNDDLVSVMTFGKRRISKSNEMELIRFCNKKYTTVIGGARKLFKHFIKTENPDKIISYANARISNGELYHKMGFTLKHHSDPNYWYYKPEAPHNIKLKHRSGYQKHRLSGILERFDSSKTEWENMRDHGYKKIYDCGNLVFEYKKITPHAK
jgi:hypothetical protein